MRKKDPNIGNKAKADLAKEEEKLRILAKTDEVKGEQLVLTTEGHTKEQQELKDFALSNIENPENKHELYYKGIQRLLLTHLPKGKQHKVSRDYIYEEKNTYLTRGKRIDEKGIRGADGRMGYTTDGEEMLQMVMDWVMENGTMVDLYNKIRDMNVKKGYGTRQL